MKIHHENIKARAYARAKKDLSTQSESIDQRTITVDVYTLQIIEKTTTITNHEHHTTTRVVIMLMLLQVISKVSNTLAQQSNLDLWGTRVTLMCRVFVDDALLIFSRQCHGVLLNITARCCNLMMQRSQSAGVTRQVLILQQRVNKINSIEYS